MQIIDGKATSLAIQDEIKEEVQRRVADGAKKPHLAAIIVGDNPASRAYVGHKIKACERVGFDSTLVELSENILEEQLLDVVLARRVMTQRAAFGRSPSSKSNSESDVVWAEMTRRASIIR